MNVVSRPSDPCTVRSRFCMPDVPPTSGSASRAPGSIAPSVGTLRPVGDRVEHGAAQHLLLHGCEVSTTGDWPER